MDIRKLVEMELKRTLKEEKARVVVGSLANPLEFSQFLNWLKQQLPKVKNADVYYFNPAVKGQKTKEDKVFLDHYHEGKDWETDDTGKTRKDIKLQLPQYSAKEIAAQVSTAQQIMFFVNQAIGQRFDVASEKMGRVKKVGDIQQEVNILRRDYPNEFPSKIKFPNLTKRLQEILAWVKANPEKVKKTLLGGQVPIPAAQTPAAPTAKTFNSFKDMETHAKGLGPAFTGKLYYIQDINAPEGQKTVYAANYQNGKITSQNRLDESKLIRKMIIQEVYKSLRK